MLIEVSHNKAHKGIAGKKYFELAKVYKTRNPLCAFEIFNVCTVMTECIYHVKGTTPWHWIIKKKWWIPSCKACKAWHEEHKEEAKQLAITSRSISGSRLSDFRKKTLLHLVPLEGHFYFKTDEGQLCKMVRKGLISSKVYDGIDEGYYSNEREVIYPITNKNM